MVFMAMARVVWASKEMEPYDMAPVTNLFTISLAGSTCSQAQKGFDTNDTAPVTNLFTISLAGSTCSQAQKRFHADESLQANKASVKTGLLMSSLLFVWCLEEQVHACEGLKVGAYLVRGIFDRHVPDVQMLTWTGQTSTAIKHISCVGGFARLATVCVIIRQLASDKVVNTADLLNWDGSTGLELEHATQVDLLI